MLNKINRKTYMHIPSHILVKILNSEKKKKTPQASKWKNRIPAKEQKWIDGVN